MWNEMEIGQELDHTWYALTMLPGHGNIEMDTTCGHVTNFLKYTRFVCPIGVSDTFRIRHGLMMGVSMLHSSQQPPIYIYRSKVVKEVISSWLITSFRSIC